MGPANDTQACLPRDTSSSADEMASHAVSVTPPPRRPPRKGCVTWPLVPLRIALFFFFGGLGCLLVFLPLHMREVGLSPEQSRLVSFVAPLVSILGPLVVGPSADRLGKHKVLLTACLLLSAACYCLLLAVPLTSSQTSSFHQESLLTRAPVVRLRCDGQGANIIQERCAPLCPAWGDLQSWEIHVKDCSFNCPDEVAQAYGSKGVTTPVATPDYLEPENEIGGEELEAVDVANPAETTESSALALALSIPTEPHPYLCFSNETNGTGEGRLCYAFMNTAPQELAVNITLPEVASLEAECHYPLSRGRMLIGNHTFSSLQCRVPSEKCSVSCALSGGLWDKSRDGQQQCPSQSMISDPSLTFWSYLLARSVADIFPAAALPLADTLVVVLSRDHHSDVGRELAWGALGAATLVPAVCFLVHIDISPWPETPSALPILVFAFLALLAAAALSGVRLQPAWYSRRMEIGGRPGPKVAHTGEAIALVLVLVILGFFWGTLDTYLPWYLKDTGSSFATLGLTVTLGTILAFPLLWNSERIIDYCGHTNLFIVTFAFYIIRFTGFGFMESTWLGISFEVFEIFTLCLMWVCAVVYARNLVSKHLTATAQAVIVLAHFCLGRFLGALIGGVAMATAGAIQTYQACALAAALLGWLYFSLYHCCLRPRCGRKTPPSQELATGDGVTSNGSYTPLRVYNGDQKRELRY